MGETRTLLRPIAVLLALCAVAFGFLELAGEVREGETQRMDEWVLRSFRTPGNLAVPRGPSWLPAAARNLTALGSFPVLLLVVLAVAGFLALARLWRTLALVLGASVGGLVLMLVLKRTFDRPRPTVVPPLTLETTASFPSGHAMMSAVVYLTLGMLVAQLCSRWRERIYVIAVAGILTLVVGLTRLYLGVHYPTDVLGGWLVGLSWAVVSGLVARALRKLSLGLRSEVPDAEGAERTPGPG
ncbi:MAG TPA: phosphatase PAP2 family protein [Myxococcaceae bacterium]|nr:phosphatase PAP2 family protein [Myxococcaceae bacterium]